MRNRAGGLLGPALGLAATTSAAALAGGGDQCADAIPISGEVSLAVDLDSDTDGPAMTACILFGQNQISNDEWFCWTASATDMVIVHTCNSPSTLDTKIAVYEGCACPVSNSDMIHCGDDECGSQSLLAFIAYAGESYLFRVGVFPLAAPGAGTVDIIVCAGDADYNGVVDIGDLAIVLANFNMTVAPAEDGDLSGDGIVDSTDLGEVLAHFGRQCL